MVFALQSAALLPGSDGVPAAVGCGLWLGAAGWLPGLVAGRLRPLGCLLLAASIADLCVDICLLRLVKCIPKSK